LPSVAVEVATCAAQLDRATTAITEAISSVSASGATIAASNRARGGATGHRLAPAAEVIRAGHATSGRGAREGQMDACALIAELRTANAGLVRPLALASEVAAIGEELGARGVRIADTLPGSHDAALRALLDQVAASYTMAAEREIHAGFLLPGMVTASAGTIEEDGLF
jgi:hypothetical protein